jgi:S1-C subfamily serine protease
MNKILNLLYVIFILCFFLWMPQNTTAIGPELPEGLIVNFGGEDKVIGNIEQRVSSSLQKVGKNLVLEQTRGTKEVALYQNIAPAVVFVLTENNFGSGAIVDKEGHVITNWHVVKDNPSVVVVFKPKNSAELKKELAFSAKVVKVDQVSDLALLKINTPPKTLKHIRLGNSSNLAAGQDVHAIGHPNGEIWTYTKGFISQVRAKYEWRTEEGLVHHAKVIQTQTPINPGSSGGPLLSDQGSLIGINSFQISGQGLNYAVAVDEIQKLLKRKESRKISSTQLSQEPRCTEAYDTTGQGWENILGCYCRSGSTTPELWLVHRNANEPAAYSAMDSKGTSRIDTVIISKDQKWQSLFYFMDLNCDGIVNLIGHQFVGEEGFDRYKYPEKDIHINTLTKELDIALKTKKIPYPKLRICQ